MDVWKDILDKVVFSLVVTILSTAVLVGYNSHSKVFEAAQADARPLTELFIKLRNEAIELSLAARREVRSSYTGGGATQLSPKLVTELRSKATHGSRVSALLEETAKDTHAAGIALFQLIQKELTALEGAGSLTLSAVEKFDKDVASAIARFLEAANREFSLVVSTEFQKFFDGYYSKVPFYAHPLWLMGTAALVLAVAVGLLFYLWRQPKAAADH